MTNENSFELGKCLEFICANFTGVSYKIFCNFNTFKITNTRSTFLAYSFEECCLLNFNIKFNRLM